MYTNTNFPIDIYIQLDNGIYIFNHESSTGKTRLFKALRGIQIFEQLVHKIDEEPVQNHASILTYTYNDLLLYNIELEPLLNDCLIDHKSVIILDRYDLYGSEMYVDVLERISKHSIILIDCNIIEKVSSFTDDKICFIEMSETSIIVTELPV